MKNNDSEIVKLIEARKDLFWDKGPLDPDRDKYVIVERILEFGDGEAETPPTVGSGDMMAVSGRLYGTALLPGNVATIFSGGGVKPEAATISDTVEVLSNG